MTRHIVKVGAVALIASFALLGCGGPEGKYKLDMSKQEEEMKKAGIEMSGSGELELKKGGEGTMTSNFTVAGKEDKDSADFTWKADGDKITITAKEDKKKDKPLECTLTDKKLTCKAGKEEMIYNKE